MKKKINNYLFKHSHLRAWPRNLPRNVARVDNRQRGQGMTEYIIIVAIIAIGAVTASGFFGARVQSQFVSMGNEISGQAGTPEGPVEAPTPESATLGSYVDN